MILRSVFLFLALVLPASLFANTVYFPQVVFGGGYSTTFIILNTGTAPVLSTVAFYDQSGASRVGLRRAINVPVGGSTRFTLPNTGPLTILWGELAAGSGTVEASATYDLRTDNGALITTATVAAVEASNAFRVPVDITSASATGIAIAHVRETGSVNVNLRLLREDGSQMAVATDARIAPLGSRRQIADFVTTMFPQLSGTAFKGTLIVEAAAGAPADSLALTVLDVREGTLAAVPVLSGSGPATTGSSTLYFPQVAFGEGYSTTLVMMNRGTTDVSSRINFYDQNGTLLPERGAPINVTSGGSTRLTLPDAGPLTVVWGELPAGSAALQGTAIIDRRVGGTLVMSSTAPATQGGQRFVFPVDATTSSSTGIAIANVVEGGPVTVNLRLVREDGFPFLTSRDVRINPLNSRRQLADYVSKLFRELQFLGSFKGTLIVEASAGSAANSLAATAFTLKERGSPVDASESLLTVLPRELTVAENNVTQAANNFSFVLWSRINSAQRGSNVFISPLSASFALGMTLNGAANQTFDEMRSALQFGTATNQEINEGYRSLVALLSGLDPAVKMQIANSIWHKNTFSFLPSFFNACIEYFGAEVRGLNFDDVTGSVNAINAWVEAKTNGKIPSIIETIKPLDVMFLINAIYFNGNWRDKFDPEKTRDDIFRPATGGPQSVKLMYRKDRMSYVERPDYQAVDLPYGNSAFTMTVVLPSANADIEAFAASLTPASWRTLTADFRNTEIELYLPKLRVGYERELNDDLMALGMRRAFEPGGADFSRMSTGGGVYISLVKQKTFVDVNELGTEAAAVTVVVATTVSGPPPPPTPVMRVDRPYLFMIRERLSGNIVFMGKIVRMP